MAEHWRTNFLMFSWYFGQHDDFQDVIDFAEGRTEPFYV